MGIPLTEQGGVTGRDRAGGGRYKRGLKCGDKGWEFAIVGEGGMEETGEEDGGDGGGWRSPLT